MALKSSEKQCYPELQTPARKTMTIESYGATDVGLRRKLNEDSLTLDNDLGLFIVADGMGGHNAGKDRFASRGGNGLQLRPALRR
jgi:hypothetical protein